MMPLSSNDNCSATGQFIYKLVYVFYVEIVCSVIPYMYVSWTFPMQLKWSRGKKTRKTVREDCKLRTNQQHMTSTQKQLSLNVPFRFAKEIPDLT